MWENRPAINNSVQAPCKNCTNRKKPKTCEKDCEKWNEYIKNKEIADAQIKEKKKVTAMFAEMYRKSKKRGK